MAHRGLLLATLLVAVVGFCECKKVTCKVKGDKMTRFGGSKNLISSVTLPCKYKAVKQRCDKYEVTVNPTAKLYGVNGEYKGVYTEAIRVVVRDAESNKVLWEGRTDNNTASKYLAKEEKAAFTVIQQDKDFKHKTKKRGGEVVLKVNGGKFEVVYKPLWGEDPNTSLWSFSCQLTGDDKKYRGKDDLAATVYSAQLCDDNRGMGITSRTSALGYNNNGDIKAFFYDTLNDTSIVQSGSCEKGTNLFSKLSEDKQRKVIDQCWQIIGSEGHTQCIAKNAQKYDVQDPDIMDVFNQCVRFVGEVGSAEQQGDACEFIGYAINGCREFNGLSRAVKDEGCVYAFSYGDTPPMLAKDEDNSY